MSLNSASTLVNISLLFIMNAITIELHSVTCSVSKIDLGAFLSATRIYTVSITLFSPIMLR